MESSNLEQKRTFRRIGSLATSVLLSALPLAAIAQTTTTLGSDDPVGKPFALWIFLVPIAGIMAVVTAFAAKAAVEKTGGR